MKGSLDLAKAIVARLGDLDNVKLPAFDQTNEIHPMIDNAMFALQNEIRENDAWMNVITLSRNIDDSELLIKCFKALNYKLI